MYRDDMKKNKTLETNTNLEKLIQTAVWMEQQMERSLDGMLMKVGIA